MFPGPSTLLPTASYLAGPGGRGAAGLLEHRWPTTEALPQSRGGAPPAHSPRARVYLGSRLPWQRHPPTPGDPLRFYASAPALGFLAWPPASRGAGEAGGRCGGTFGPSVSVWPESFLSLRPAPCAEGSPEPDRGGQTRGSPKAEPSSITYVMGCNFYCFVFLLAESHSVSFLEL